MRRQFPIVLLIAVSSVGLPARVVLGQEEPARPGPSAATGSQAAPLRLTLDEAVKMAVEHNVDLAVDRLGPQIGSTRVASAQGAFKPVFNTSVQRNNEFDPPGNLLYPVATHTDAVTSSFAIKQVLPWLGTSYSVSWNAVHTSTNSFLNTFNPLVQSGLSANVSQPLVRDRTIDAARQQLAFRRLDRDVADTELRETTVHTTAMVKSAYWNLVSAIANVAARRSALELAEELVRVNSVKVSVGQSPPVDLVSAGAEVAANQEQLIIAETRVKQVQDELRMLILDSSNLNAWKVEIEPVDTPPTTMAALDLDQAVVNALANRTDLARARTDIAHARVNVQFTRNQQMPDVRVTAGYLASGLGGTAVVRDGGFPGTIIGEGPATGFGSILNQVLTGRYSTWSVGVTVSYPIGQATEQAEHARARLEHEQSQERLKSAEARAIQQIRDAWWKADMNARRIETTRAARELAEQRLNDEQKRFEVGVSTSFLVIQAQRDLAQARANELAAVLAYDLALVDFEALQQAGPAQPLQPAAAASVMSR